MATVKQSINQPPIWCCQTGDSDDFPLLEPLVAALAAQGWRVGVVRITATLAVDIPGKDSYELRQAGVERLILGAGKKSALMVEHPRGPAPSAAELIGLLDQDQLDVVLISSVSNLPYPVIFHGPPQTAPPHHVAIITDASQHRGADCFASNDLAGLCHYLAMNYLTSHPGGSP